MAAELLSNRPGQGEKIGECVKYAGEKCFGILFGANKAKEIFTNTKTNTGGTLPYYKNVWLMPEPPCCIIWGNGVNGHVGVIESYTGSDTNKKYRFSDCNRSPLNGGKVDIKTNMTELAIKQLISENDFLGYVKFK